MFLFPLLSSWAAAEPTTYTLDADKSWLYVVVWNDTSAMASGMGHDHGVKATEFTGTVTWDPDDPSACKVSMDVPVSGLRPDPSGMRARAGLDPDGAVRSNSLETIRNNFMGKRQLDAATFGSISYRSTSCTGSQGRYDVVGSLSIHGVSQSVSTKMTIEANGSTFKASGTFESTHTAFGFKPFSNLGGALRNLDRLNFVVDVVGSH